MNYLELDNITKSFGERILFQNITFYIEKGQKVALIAKNGTGKTTLLKIAAGLETSEGEHYTALIHKDIKVAYLDQNPNLPPNLTVIEAVFEGNSDTLRAIRKYEECLLFPEKQTQLDDAIHDMDRLNAWDYEIRIKQILSVFNIRNLDQRVGSLSGGQQKRVALAKVLIEEPDFIILDEPTNHLDLEMIEWLEDYLNRANLTILMVTHDRYFLDRVCNTILELDNSTIYKYKGNYQQYLESKSLREQVLLSEVSKANNLLRTELEWMRRQPKARGTKAKARIDAFYDLSDKASQKISDEKVQIEIKTTRMGSKIVELHNVTKQYGDLILIDKFTYKFKKSERVGIVGKNGIGKSTFLNLIMHHETPDGGKVVIGDTIQFGYYTQDGISLKEDKRVIEVIKDIAPFIPVEKGKSISAAQLLERFLFTPDQQYTYVSKLSGGERRRLYLLTILMANPNFLILDEPTNDLDILTLNVLESFLMEYDGCLIIVSHDRHFMDKLVDHVFVFEGNGVIRDYPGNYSDYRAYKELLAAEQRNATKTPEKNKTNPTTSATSPTPTTDDKQRLSYEERKEFNRLEKEINQLEQRKKTIHEAFNDPSMPPAKMNDLSKELGDIQKNIDAKELRWLELSERA
jgi:ATP-binding cassette subfamily F protein uup